jgi:hypothetical protein
MRVRQKRLRAHAFAATAVAIRFAGLDVPLSAAGLRLGEISLDDARWRDRILDEAGAAAGLDDTKQPVPGGVALAINWSAYALRKIGAPAQSLGELNMVRFDRAVQRLDVETF